MNAGLLERLMGGDRGWSGPCTIIVDADAAVKTSGPDSIVGGGVKTYAPRYASGRIEADSCFLLKEQNSLLVVRQQRLRDSTGAEQIRQALVVADVAHLVAVEFTDLAALRTLGVPPPPAPSSSEYRPGTLVG